MKASVLRLQASLVEMTPEQIALVLSVGLVLGVFPAMGIPTLLCLVAAFGLRLNFAALQVINNISSPLQLVLLLPLARAGARFYGTAPLSGRWAGSIGTAAIHAATGWVCICIPLGAVMYFSLRFFLRVTMRQQHESATAS